MVCCFTALLSVPLVADLGTNSVSGTLSSLQHSNPRDDFDMFAQTRGSSLAEQRKKYVEFVFSTVWVMGLLFSKGINLKLLDFVPEWKSSFGLCFCASHPILILLVIIRMSKWRSSCCCGQNRPAEKCYLTVTVNELTGNLEMYLPLFLQMLPLIKACHPIHPASAWDTGA